MEPFGFGVDSAAVRGKVQLLRTIIVHDPAALPSPRRRSAGALKDNTWRHRGAGDRIDYTVHGDAVNLAARLEQRCAIWRHRMLVE